ncbi:MAG: hypothetical protein ACOC1Z_00815 [Cyanobacteriota bacterium]
MKEKFLLWLDRALMADLFLVLASFFWFAIALVGRSADVPLGLDLWYKLWEPVFTPAIGILMLGAIGNGMIRQIAKRYGKQ